MSELPDLPPAPRRTRPLPEGGLEAVVSAGRARRARALAAGTTTTLALVLAGVLVQPTGALDALNAAFRPAPVPTVAPSSAPASEPPVASPAPAPEPPEVRAPTDPPAVPSPSAAAVPDEPAAPRPTSQGERMAAPASPPPAPAVAAPVQRPAFREDTDEDAAGSPLCVPGRVVTGPTATASPSPGPSPSPRPSPRTSPSPSPGPGAGSGAGPRTEGDSGSCSYQVDSGGTVRRGGQVTTSYGQCSASGQRDTVFVFGGGQEKEVLVTDQEGKEVFRFSATVRYVEGAHERRLRAGSCIEWTGRWDLVTTAGEPVPAGTYRMTTTVAADRVFTEGQEDRAQPDFRASSSVTVRVVG